MRIGLVIYGDLDTLTGGYLYDRIMVEALEARGHQVEVVSLAHGSYLDRLRQGVSPQLRARLRDGGFDLLLQDELCHPSLFEVNRRLRRSGGPPTVAIVHQVLCDEPRNRWLNRLYSLPERRYLASVDGYVFNSRTTRRTVETLLGAERPHVIAFPAGDRFGRPLAREEVRARGLQPGPLELLFLGNLIPRKGLLPLIEALVSVERGSWRLSVVGSEDFDHGYAAAARRLVGRLELADAVRFLGPLQGDELRRQLTASHLFCMPYAYEGFGIAILEAMAFGLPAIGSAAGAAGETISNGVNGFLLAPDDRKGLAPILAGLHQDRQRLLEMADAALDTFEDRPGWQEGADAIDGFLREMASGGKYGVAGATGIQPRRVKGETEQSRRGSDAGHG